MSEIKFNIGQDVVYPSQGVGRITEIFEKEFRGVSQLYYKMYIEASDMIVLVPVEKACELGIRSIVNAEEAQSAINILSEEVGSITSDWKLRYQSNLDLLKKGTIADIAQIVRCLYNRSKVKELPILERKLYDQAKKLLQDEISIAMKRDPKEVEAEIMTKLEPPGAMLKVKHNPFDDEDEDDDLMSDVTDSKDNDEDDDSDELDDSDSDIDSQDDFDDDAEF